VDLQAELIGAVDRSEIAVFYQPQIDMVTEDIVAAEALSRWIHPTHGVLPPKAFIAEAERSELIHEIGAFMLDSGCRDVADWHEKGYGIEVAVNVSALQLGTVSFFEHLIHNLAELKLVRHSITVEITESRAITNLADAAARLMDMRDLGVDISIDDFGTGFSSVAQVLSLPATELKIDRSLVQGDPALTRQTLTTVIELAHDRGLRVVAEGVETTEQFERVRELGCDRCQGYLIGRPTSHDEIDELFEQVF
jgi:EAL domain-containing protein (putative c-di-GMP-specific phosphodiesterase class I)